MSNYFDEFDDKHSRQFETRASGQLNKGPLQAVGYDSRVMANTTGEPGFGNSVESHSLYQDSKTPKLADKKRLCKQRRVKLYSTQSD